MEESEKRSSDAGHEASRVDESRTLADSSKTLADSAKAPEASPASLPAPSIPDHELITRIGRGSYGEVWLARNVMGTFRAVKLVYRATFEHARPFDREFNGIKKFEPISRSHDGLVDVLQVGRVDEYFYYVMELADDVTTGQEIDPAHYTPRTLRSAASEQGRVGFEDCVQIGLSLTQALGHMHKHGLIHRDIKPSNIIFVHGTTKLADIGLVAEQSEAKSFVGTEGFIPPEGPGAPQADIYSLGKVLYEISTGKDRHEFPALPTLLGDTTSDTHLLELNSVFLKACQSDLKHRYQTCEQMRDDLVLLQSGKSVKRSQEVERRLRRLTRASVAGTVVTLLAIGGFSYAKSQQHKAQEQARREAGLRQRAERSELEARKNLYSADMLLAPQALAENNSGRVLELLDRHRPQVGRNDLRGWEWRYLWSACRSDELATLGKSRSGVGNLALLPDGTTLLVLADGEVKRLDIPSRRELPHVSGDVSFWPMALSPDGNTVAVGTGNRELLLVDVQTGAVKSRLSMRFDNFSRGVAFSPDGTLLALGHLDGRIGLWQLPGATHLLDLTNHSETVWSLAFSSDGNSLASAGGDGFVKLWDVQTGRQKANLSGHSKGVLLVAFSPDGRLLASTSWDKTARLWDVDAGEPLATLTNHTSAVFTVTFSPDGRTLATGSGDQTIKLWNVAERREVATLKGHRDDVWTLAFSPDGQTLISGGKDRQVKLWSIVPRQSPIGRIAIRSTFKIDRYGRNATRIGLSADRRSFLTVEPEGTAKLWDARTLEVKVVLQLKENAVTCLALSPGARHAAFADPGGKLSLWDLDAKSEVLNGQASHEGITGLAFAPDGTTLVSLASREPGIKVWRLDHPLTARGFGRELKVAGIGEIAFSPDSRILGVIENGRVSLWELDTGREMPPIQKGSLSGLDFSPDGKRLAVATVYGPVTLWDWAAQRLIASFGGEATSAESVAFSPDGKRLAFGLSKGVVKVWDPEAEQEVASFRAHSDWVDFAFFADNDTLVTGTTAELKAWRAAPFAETDASEKMPAPAPSR